MSYISEEKPTNKKKRPIHYPINKIYFGSVEGNDCIIYELMENNVLRYIELFIIQGFVFIEREVKSFRLEQTLKEEIDSKNMNLCLLTKDGKEKSALTIDEIINVIKLRKILENKSFDSLNPLCNNLTNKITDLLGINVYSNPSSDLKLADVDEVVVPATKEERFKTLLFDYIKLSIILDNGITISNNDYRILRALNGAKIKTVMFKNEFTITFSGDTIRINCPNIIGGPGNFQKRFRNS